MTVQLFERFRRASEGPEAWQWFLGFARIGVLLVIFFAVFVFEPKAGLRYLLAFYLIGFSGAVLYLLFFERAYPYQLWSNWAQVLVDFSVVAATVGFTGGPNSFLAFLFVIVILESGLLLGLGPSFFFASIATAFMVIQAVAPPEDMSFPSLVSLWYNVLIQGLAFYLTAFISSYWNQRVHRMQLLQHELLDNMNNGFLITDLTGLILAINKGAERILHLKEGEAISRPVQEVLRPESGGECPVMTALRSQRDFTSYEFNALTSAGEVKLLGLTTNTMHDSRMTPEGMIASFTDLTDMARMRQELRRQDRLAVVGELAASLAHEIRNPLAAIRGAVDELKSRLNSPEVAGKLLAIAVREADQLNHIVSDFLDLARKPSAQREHFEVRALVDEVCDLLRAKHDGATVLFIRAELPNRPCAIFGDRSQIKQVFLNLGINAIEANVAPVYNRRLRAPDTGYKPALHSLNLGANAGDAMAGRGALTVFVTPGAGFVEIRFDDQGPGIHPDKVARIFEPFYSTKPSGVGMGLAICLRIVTAHDGTIRAMSREGGGTSMIVRLPAAHPEN